MTELFAEVILPLSLHDSYTYRVPVELAQKAAPGKRAVVQFGSKKYYAGLILSLSEKKPQIDEIKTITQILDENPVVLPKNLDLWKWMAKYYCCALGDVFRAALPSGLKLESKSKIIPAENEDIDEISKAEKLIFNEVGKEVLTLVELQRKLGEDFSYGALKSLLQKNFISIEEKISSRYKEKTEIFVRLHSNITSEKEINQKADELQRAKKQKALFFHFLEKTEVFNGNLKAEIGKKQLLEDTSFSSSLLAALVKKKILGIYQKPVSRLQDDYDGQVELNMLSKQQAKAYNEIEQSFEEKAVTLLHGVTASGKTEIYIHLIHKVLREGRQALYLVPEIALTTQIIHRLKAAFGAKVGIYHSRLSSQERVEIWNKVLAFQHTPEKAYQIILGARSSLFLPFSNPGIIIVDEEHENSFKQYDPAPRYHARDMAVILGLLNNAKVLLGSATPSFESYYNAISKKYGLVKLLNRHSNLDLPEIVVADVKQAYKRKAMHSFLSPELYKLVDEALTNNEQVILFQNRRGYSPFVECFTCGWIPKCANCDVSLTYHKYKKRLNCHYCGYSQAYPAECHDCGSPEIKSRGFGTEKIEDELKSLFKNATIARMDMDTTQTKNAFRKIIDNLESQRTDILIGTQMVTKGLDFDNVSVVGILNADNLINFPDFRAHERACQLILQVSGRAGRKHKRGKVVIQTSQPEHEIIQQILSQDYENVIKIQLGERQLFRYPPYSRLIKLTVKHKKADTVDRISELLGKKIREQKQLIVLGPEYPLIGKIQLWYQKEIWIKINKSLNLNEVKNFILDNIKVVKQQTNNSNSIINVDVDPV